MMPFFFCAIRTPKVSVARATAVEEQPRLQAPTPPCPRPDTVSADVAAASKRELHKVVFGNFDDADVSNCRIADIVMIGKDFTGDQMIQHGRRPRKPKGYFSVYTVPVLADDGVFAPPCCFVNSCCPRTWTEVKDDLPCTTLRSRNPRQNCAQCTY
jgi:hypothetical protein